MNNKILRTINIVSILLLLIALFPMKYWYYDILRFCIFFVFFLYVVFFRMSNQNKFLLGAIAFAVLYNPIIKIHFTKHIWQGINVASAIFLVMILINFLPTARNRIENKKMTLLEKNTN